MPSRRAVRLSGPTTTRCGFGRPSRVFVVALPRPAAQTRRCQRSAPAGAWPPWASSRSGIAPIVLDRRQVGGIRPRLDRAPAALCCSRSLLCAIYGVRSRSSVRSFCRAAALSAGSGALPGPPDGVSPPMATVAPRLASAWRVSSITSGTRPRACFRTSSPVAMSTLPLPAGAGAPSRVFRPAVQIRVALPVDVERAGPMDRGDQLALRVHLFDPRHDQLGVSRLAHPHGD